MKLNIYPKVSHAYTRVDEIVDLTWTELIELLITKVDAKSKDMVPLFNLWEFDTKGEKGVRNIYVDGKKTGEQKQIPFTVRRCGNNAIALHGLVLDVDNDLSIEQAKANFVDYEYLLYTTFNNTEAKNKFRVVLPFTEPMPLAEFNKKKEDMVKHFGVALESFSISQCFYFHSGKVPLLHYNEGDVLDWNKFDDKEEVVVKATTFQRDMTQDQSNAYKEKVINSLLTCSNVRYASGLLLGSICKSVELNLEDYRGIIMQIGGGDSLIRDSVDMLWNDCENCGVKAHTRDKFIAQHGGVNHVTDAQQKKISRKQRLLQKYKSKN